MKLSITSFIILVLLSCSKNSDPAPVQLLTNRDMESGTTQPLSWFYGHTAPEIPMTWATAVSSSPTHSLQMSRTTITDVSSFAAWGQTFQGVMPIGKDLTFAVKIKGDNLVGQGLSIAIRVDDTTTALQFSTTQGNIYIGGTFDWKTYTVKLPGVSSQAKYIVVYLVYLPSTTGAAYFDDASLVF